MTIFLGILPVYPQTQRALICAKKIYDVIERVPLIRDEPDCVTDI